MAKRKKRKRRPSTVRPSEAEVVSVEGPPSGSSRARSGRSAATRDASRRAARPLPARPASPYPPIGVSLAKGMHAVARSPALLVTSFLAALALWGAFSVYGVFLAASPAAMVQMESLPPVHSFLDIQFLAAGRSASAVALGGLAVGLLLVRAALLALWTSLILASLDEASGTGAPGREVVRRATRSLFPMLGVEAGFFLISVSSLFLVAGFLGPAFGQLGIIAALLGGMYFFIFAPVVLVAEGVGVREAARLAIKAARLPGQRHVFLTFGYLTLAIFLSLSTPGSRLAYATPSLTVWIFVLFVSFIHLSVLAAYVYRWLAVRRLLLPDEARTPKADVDEMGALN